MKNILLLVLLSLSASGWAVDIKTLNPVETIEVKPEGFKSSIKYNVTLPQNYQQEQGKRYFLLFDLHPRIQPLISGMHDWLSHNGEWPWLKTIVVTPAGYNAEFAAELENLVADPSNQRLLDIIEHGVLKQVDKKYRTNGFRIYSGFMSNGAIGLYALLNRPSMFDAYFISSPTLNNDFGRVLSDAPTKLMAEYNKMKFLYMTIGDHNYEKAHVASFKQFEGALSKHNNSQLTWHSNNQDEHYYMSRPVVTILEGIETLFNDIHEDLAPDSEISKRGVDAIIAYYNDLSKHKYGFEISAEGSLKSLAKSIAISSPSEAMAIYTKVTKLYPESAYAHASLAKALAEQGSIEQAIQVQSVAVEKSKSMNPWHQNKHRQYLDEYKSMLKR